MFAREARRLTEQLLPSLRQAGFAGQAMSAADGEEYWPVFTELVADFLAELASPRTGTDTSPTRVGDDRR
jgi:hypothetical protein